MLLPIAGSLINLGLVKCNIRTLRALQYFIQLEVLNLRLNRLHGSTFKHLNHLKNLKNLDLGGIGLKDTSVLSGLIGLEILSISGGNPYREIKGLEPLKSLQHLNISWSSIDNIKKINVNENIRSLNIGETNIKKIEGLERFPHLEELRGLITKIEGLDKSYNLKKLFISATSVEEIEGLDSLKNLEVLDLSYNEISKIKGLKYLKNLKKLSLNENMISKVENLDHLINLEYLTLEVNKIKEFDASFLSNLISECFISLCFTDIDRKGIKDIPQNVTIKFEADHFVPRTLYNAKDFFR